MSTGRDALLAIGMTTAPREEPTLEATLASLRAAGFQESVHLFAEAASLTTPCQHTDVSLHQHLRTLGCFPNWIHMAGWLLDNTDAEFLMLCEDDVEFCRTAANRVKHGLVTLQNVGYLSAYTPRHNLKVGRCAATSGWVALNVGRVSWGSLAYAFPRHVLREVLRLVDTKAEDGTDYRVSEALFQLGRDCWFHIPSLCRHIGYTSTIGHTEKEGSVAVGFEAAF